MNDKVGSTTSTRNNVLNKKHMTTTTSPVERFGESKSNNMRLSNGKKQSITGNLLNNTTSHSHINPFKITRNQNTVEI